MKHGERVTMLGYGGPEQLRYDRQDKPSPGAGEIVVEVVATGVSHMDTFVREGRYRDSLEVSFPSGQGTCFAGIVRDVGPGVVWIKRGADVLGHDPAHAAHATWVRVGAGAVVPKPGKLEWETAGGLYLTGATALDVVKSLHLQKDEIVAVTAAAGGVGHVQCQLGRIAGAQVIGIGDQENHDYLRSIGATPVQHGDGLEDRLREVLKGRPLAALIDNYGKAGWIAEAFGVPPQRVRTSEDRGRVEVRYYSAPADDVEVRSTLQELVGLVVDGGLRPLTSRFFAFHQIPEALAEMDRRRSRGKVVVGTHAVAPETSYLDDRLRTHYARSGPAHT